MNKQEIRKIIRDRKRQFTQEKLGELSLSVISQLRNHPRVKEAHTLLLYYSLPDEVNTHEWIDELAKEGKKVLLPVVVDDKQMILREYNGKEDLKEGSFHIMEPIGKLFAEDKYGEIEIGIIPGMSFDEKLHRLGRGKGYYDRFLEKVEKLSKSYKKAEESSIPSHREGKSSALYKIGVCFGFQREKELPSNRHDIKMDEVIASKENNAI